eukprot:TRINITY_DN459_c0_g2_i2.p1 TRINITY_DN459_c0_g2~~TRINITY_DN459_c0_g2_i2.p1  ORF type:complete len:277 (+),score=62.94 TRINITY_DN459_c0_g2_i2:153-983(+)
MEAIASSTALQVCAPTKALLAKREAPISASATAGRAVSLPTKDARSWRLSSAAAASDAAACFRRSDFFDNALSALVPLAGPSSGGARRAAVEMSAESLHRAYAAAILEVGQSKGCLDSIHCDMEKLEEVCKEGGMNLFLSNPVLSLEKKKEVLNMIATDLALHPYTKSFMGLLVDQKRSHLLGDVAAEFEGLYCQATGMEVAEVTSAIKLNNPQQARIAKKLQELTGAKKIKLRSTVDPSLIAGFKLKFGKGGSMLVDLSVQGQLTNMQSEFAVST